MAETTLTRERLHQDGERVVALSHIRGVDLARVASKYDFGAVTDASQDCFQRCWLEVLCLINDHDLGLQAAPTQESDRFKG